MAEQNPYAYVSSAGLSSRQVIKQSSYTTTPAISSEATPLASGTFTQKSQITSEHLKMLDTTVELQVSPEKGGKQYTTVRVESNHADKNSAENMVKPVSEYRDENRENT
ncbi:hypothetical protein NYO67_2126 [Aspergillus flavus]|nr:hypothetical protein NYO67_2126 [Aspergillus flavus]